MPFVHHVRIRPPLVEQRRTPRSSSRHSRNSPAPESASCFRRPFLRSCRRICMREALRRGLETGDVMRSAGRPGLQPVVETNTNAPATARTSVGRATAAPSGARRVPGPERRCVAGARAPSSAREDGRARTREASGVCRRARRGPHAARDARPAGGHVRGAPRATRNRPPHLAVGVWANSGSNPGIYSFAITTSAFCFPRPPFDAAPPRAASPATVRRAAASTRDPRHHGADRHPSTPAISAYVSSTSRNHTACRTPR